MNVIISGRGVNSRWISHQIAGDLRSRDQKCLAPQVATLKNCQQTLGAVLARDKVYLRPGFRQYRCRSWPNSSNLEVHESTGIPATCLQPSQKPFRSIHRSQKQKVEFLKMADRLVKRFPRGRVPDLNCGDFNHLGSQSFQLLTQYTRLLACARDGDSLSS